MRSRIRSVILPLLLLLSGCQIVAPSASNEEIVDAVSARSGALPRPEIPPKLDVSKGLTDDQAVSLALWNNPQFHAALMRLGLARGDLIQAGLLTNPNVQLVFPIGPKIFESMAFIPLEALVLRPLRSDVAATELERLKQELIQVGLDLVRDVRLACAELTFAQERAALANEAVRVQKNILDLSEKQLKAGDISELEVINARATYLQSKAGAAQIRMNVPIAENNLRQLLGLSLKPVPLALIPSTVKPIQHDHQALLAKALAVRPDLKAASIAIENAKKQVELTHWNILQFGGIIDINSPGQKGFEIGPGMSLTLPIFNRNEGARARAEAQVEQLIRQQEALRQQVALEIQNALAQQKQARDNYKVIKEEVLPTLNEGRQLAEKAFQRGGSSYLLVLQLNSQYLTARARELELMRDQRRAQAQIERSVGYQP